VKRYHVEVREIGVPSDEEVEARKVARVVDLLVEEGGKLPLETFADLGPVARAVLAHDLRERIVAVLLKDVLAKKVPPDEPDDEVDPGARHPEGRRDEGGRRRRRRPGRRY
jgi:hypothetical protein